MGWLPPSTSMIERRRRPKVTPPRGTLPSPSAPRVRLAAGDTDDPTHLFATSSDRRPPIRRCLLARRLGFDHLAHDVHGLALRLVIRADGELGQQAHEA